MLYRFLLLLFFCISIRLDSNAQIQEFIFSEKFEQYEGNSNICPISCPSKNQIAKSDKYALFNICYDESNGIFPDSVRKCVEMASMVWGRKINASQKIVVNVDWMDSMVDDIKTTVLYRTVDTYMIPNALYKQTHSMDDSVGSDMTISINKNSCWDCSFDTLSTRTSKNLPTAILRALAVGLGFGANLTSASRNQILQKGGKHSVFNTLLKAENNTILSELSHRSTAMKQFCTGEMGAVYAKSNRPERKMYSPATFEDGKSLIFMDSSNSLMYHNITEGMKKLSVDSVTEAILNELGWCVQFDNPFSIRSVDIDSTGIASAYQAHSFEIESEYISTGNWTFLLPNSENEYVQIASLTNSNTFTICPINNEDNYKKDCNGDIVGIVRCSAYINGIEHTEEYYVTLEFRPIITNVVIKQIVPQPNGQMSDIYFDVYYVGTDHLEMSIEREYSVATRNSFINEPYIAHVKAANIYNSVYSWIDIFASNVYGTAVKTIEVSPEGDVVIPEILNVILDGEYDPHTESFLYRASVTFDVSAPHNVNHFWAMGTDFGTEKKDSCVFTWINDDLKYEEIGHNEYRVKIDGMDLKQHIRLAYTDNNKNTHKYRIIYTSDLLEIEDRTQIQSNYHNIGETEVSVINPQGNMLYIGNDLNEFKKTHTGVYIIILKDKKGNIRTKNVYYETISLDFCSIHDEYFMGSQGLSL